MFHFRPIPFFGAVAALLLTGCYDSRFGEPDDDGEGKPATETIAALRDRYAGTPFTVTGDIVVTGRVASCDRAENFYRTLCICDAEAGLEVMAGIDHLHNGFPIGSRVTLSLRGLAIAESRGVLQAGRPPRARPPWAAWETPAAASPDPAGSHPDAVHSRGVPAPPLVSVCPLSHGSRIPPKHS